MSIIIFKKEYNLNLDILDRCTKRTKDLKNSRLGLIIKCLSASVGADGLYPENLDEHDLFFKPKTESEKILWENLRESAKIQIKSIITSRENGKKGGRPKIIEEQVITKEIKQENPISDKDLPPLTPKKTEEEFFAWAEQMNQCAGMGGFTNTPEQREAFWNHFSAQGWRRKNGMPISDIVPLFKIWVREDNKNHADDIPLAPRIV